MLILFMGALLALAALASFTSTSFATGNPLTEEKWSKKLFAYGLDHMFFTQKGMISREAGSIIQVISELEGEKIAGDQVTMRLRYPLSEAGQGDDGTILTNNEALVIANFNIKIHERAHSTKLAGKMSGKRTSIKFREEGMGALGDWVAQAIENDIYAAAAGLYNVSSAIATVNEAAPSANRRYIGGHTLTGTGPTKYGSLASVTTSLDDGAQMSLQLLSVVKRKARLADPQIRPLVVKGERWHVVLLHPYQVKSIKNSTATNNWTQIQRDANIRGEKNPLFTGAVGVWDGMILHEYDRIATCTGAGSSAIAEGFQQKATAASRTPDAAASGVSFARAIFLGAQSVGLAWGQRPSWGEEFADIAELKRQPVIGTDMLYGVAKTQFSKFTGSASNTAQEDFGAFVIDTTIFADE